MAKRLDNLSGMIGPVVIYTLNGRMIMRSKPRRYKQTPATKASGKNFGIASGAASVIYRRMSANMDVDTSAKPALTGLLSRLLSSLTKTVVEQSDAIARLEDFSFTGKNPLNRQWKKLLNVSFEENQFTIQIASFDPSKIFSAGKKGCTIKCEFIATTVGAGRDLELERKTIEFVYGDDVINAQTIQLPVTASNKTKDVFLLMCSMDYVRKIVYDDKGWEKKEAGVVAVALD